MIVLEGWSSEQVLSSKAGAMTYSRLRVHSPGFSAPQQWQCKIFFSLPLDAGRRSPQSVQKINDPIAAIFAGEFDW